mmetsp:Transcript_24448/g.34513  ORF Transcript_24448/g.34513 Transcript_24448/m.34513 type:complete len:129 (-) Transcript_24448:923-1309(-)
MEEFGHLGDEIKQLSLEDSQANFVCTVSDPEKKVDGMIEYISEYIQYKVTTEQNTAGKMNQSCVFRRFSDFVWLHTQLANKCKGCLIPPLPEKKLHGPFRRGGHQRTNQGAEHIPEPDWGASHPVLAR